jgi:UDP-N-acetylmuramate--alanine ligase
VKRRVRRVHFVGIGGAGMSGLAEILHASGYRVTGSDVRASETLTRLRGLGIPVALGHDATHVGSPDVVVFSSAIAQTNPELAAARAARIPVIPRAELLAELMRLKQGVAIGGSHGKTTTTSMVAAVLEAGGLDPTTIVGGRLQHLGAHARLGSGDVLVAEADESDGSFLRLWPAFVVITNVDREHLDHWGDFAALRAGFRDFADRVPFWGAAVLCLDDPELRALLPEISRRVVSYGLLPQADLCADAIAFEGLGSRFRARRGRSDLGDFALRVPGAHNVRNALAALAIGAEFDVPPARMREALAEFRGVARRFELHGEARGVLVVEDYGHHPAEIRATLDAARQALPGRRLVVAFQPHRYTRTRDLFDEFADAFHEADVLVLTDVYAAGEPKLPGVDAEGLVAAARERGHRDARFARERAELLRALAVEARSGDAIFLLGAGDIGQLAEPLLRALEGGRRD